MLGQNYLYGLQSAEQSNPLAIGMNALRNSSNAGMSLLNLLNAPTHFSDIHQRYGDIHQSSLANILGQQEKNQYFPQTMKDKHNLIQSQITRNSLPSSGLWQIVNTPSGIMRVNKSTGQAQPVQNNGQTIQPLVNRGLSISGDGQGGYTITQGGLQPLNNTNVNKNGIQVMPTGANTSRSLAGSVQYDPKTNKYISTLTSQNTSKNQRAIQGMNRAVIQLDQLSKNLAPLQGLEGKLDLYGGMINNLLPESLRYKQEAVSPEMKATGDTLLNTIPESMISAFNLNPTDFSIKGMQDALRPKTGETKNQYENRINTIKNDMYSFINKYKNSLRGGINISPSSVSNASPKNQTLPSKVNKVRIKAPNGKYYMIAPKDVDAYIASGGVRA